MGELNGDDLRSKFTTACAASRPGPAHTPRFEGKPAIYGAVLKRAARQGQSSRRGRFFPPQRKFILCAARAHAFGWRPCKSKGARNFPRANLQTARVWLRAKDSTDREVSEDRK